jgi:hypothetical protein
LRIGRLIVCQPAQASVSASYVFAAGFASTFDSWSRLRQVVSSFGSLQCLPAP